MAIYRDLCNGDLYIATAAHIVGLGTTGSQQPGPAELWLIDDARRRYTPVQIIMRDTMLDLAIIRVHPPADAPDACVVRVAGSCSDGDPVYCVGWPQVKDTVSVTRGCVRSATYSRCGSLSEILVDCPMLGSWNAGAGVFDDASGALVGIASWGLAGQETFNGLVPGKSVERALQALMYDARPCPWPVAYDSYHIGIVSELVDPFTFATLSPSHPALIGVGCAGVLVWAARPDAPAAVQACIPVLSGGNIDVAVTSSVTILWAIAPMANHAREPEWHLVSEEWPVARLLDAIHEQTSRCTGAPQRPTAYACTPSGTAEVTNALQPGLAVTLLVSSVTRTPSGDFVHDDNFRSIPVVLPSRTAAFPDAQTAAEEALADAPTPDYTQLTAAPTDIRNAVIWRGLASQNDMGRYGTKPSTRLAALIAALADRASLLGGKRTAV